MHKAVSVNKLFAASFRRPGLLASCRAHSFSTQSGPGSLHPPPLTLQIWGSNTGVGKTVLSAALLRNAQTQSLYLKPVQSGYPDDDDGAIVAKLAPNARSTTLLNLEQPVSPDLAARLATSPVPGDDELCRKVVDSLDDFAHYARSFGSGGRCMSLVETAGGVLSPSPSGALQADMYRALRLPAVLLGDSRLGGISATIAAYEALLGRGYDVPAVVLFDNPELENEVSVQHHIKPGTAVFVAPALPPREVPLTEYFAQKDAEEFYLNLYTHLKYVDTERTAELTEMREDAKNIFWYPFTQHSKLGNVTCVDSAHGDVFTCHGEDGMHRMMDSIGSWWTNGVGHGNHQVSSAIGQAVARYGHVMFAEAVNSPSYNLAKELLRGPGSGWAARVFYSDNGSTAVEVALKMAFRRREEQFPDRSKLPTLIVGIDGCYHGDTLGVMDCAPRSDYNARQMAWYEPRGIFFTPPVACIEDGIWTVRMPDWVEEEDVQFKSLDQIVDNRREYPAYKSTIAKRLDEVLEAGEADIGALLIEPVMQGAGGMRLIDPAFQRALVDECRSRGIPVVYDEVFTGLYRLGAESGATILGRNPDIAAYAKLLTGGSVPLAVTLARSEVFEAFQGDSKRDALLHGHSYTGHVAGCAAALESLRQYRCSERFITEENKFKESWNEMQAREISCLEDVDNVTIIGTVLAIELKADEFGYASTGAADMVRKLKDAGLLARPLGNVIYVTCSPVTENKQCEHTAKTLLRVLEGDAVHEKKRKKRGEESENTSGESGENNVFEL